MSDQQETYVKKLPDGTTKERVVVSAADRVEAKFAGFHPKKKTTSNTSTSSTAKPGDAKAQDNK